MESQWSQNKRIVFVSVIAIGVALFAGIAAEVLTALIAFITNLSFYGRVSLTPVSPAGNTLGLAVIAVPMVGALLVGLAARFGSPAIRGHGIPEAMEQVLYNDSRIPARITLLKPVSAAVSIGTGGPFGAEGPIIATGGALGSLAGQLLHITADERKTLLAAGAAAGMTATFGSPVAAVLLAVELLLFEYKARSLIPVALASAVATSVRIALGGHSPVFPMPDVITPTGWALAAYTGLGAILGLAAVVVTKSVYRIEDAFERLPIHWMWWPIIGAFVVGVVGVFEPRTMGVGYDNIVHVLGGDIVGKALTLLVVLKFVSWVVALGSGTSGGTLAPLFTIGGGLGAILGTAIVAAAPALGVDAHVAALVGMAAMFAGASRALLTSIVFAFETTRQPIGLLPLLAGCSAAYLVSLLLMRTTIMTEKLARRGANIRNEYTVDFLEHVLVRDVASTEVIVLRRDDFVEDVRDWMASGAEGSSHQGFPVEDPDGALIGVVTRRDLLDLDLAIDAQVGHLVRQRPITVYEDETARDAADYMVRAGVGRLPVIKRGDRSQVVGIVTRSDLLEAHARRLDASQRASRHIAIDPVAFVSRLRARATGDGDDPSDAG